jgi:hypothetical protein
LRRACDAADVSRYGAGAVYGDQWSDKAEGDHEAAKLAKHAYTAFPLNLTQLRRLPTDQPFVSKRYH